MTEAGGKKTVMKKNHCEGLGMKNMAKLKNLAGGLNNRSLVEQSVN